jgi:hypothetical protein
MTKDYAKLIVGGLVSAYFLWCAYDPSNWHFIDGVNLLVHEAGHLIFMPFGEYIMIAGGSLFQIIMPAAFVGYFLYQQQYFSSALTLFWMGESILNVSVYAKDAIAMQLPLLGGQDSVHDWNYLLEHAGILERTSEIAGLIRMIGTLCILAAVAGSIYFARSEAREPSTGSRFTAER